MTKMLLSMTVLLSAVGAFADPDHGQELPTGAVYFAGKQPVGLVDEKDCYVEAVFSEDGTKVEVRTIINDPHHNEIVGKGVIDADYSTTDGGYVYLTTESDASVKWMLLSAKSMKTADFMEILFFDEDHGHDHSAACNKLSEAEGSVLVDIKEMFEHFNDYVEEEGHGNADDHDHDHQH